MKLFLRVQQVGKCIDHSNNATQQSLFEQCWVKLEKKYFVKFTRRRGKEFPLSGPLVNLCYSNLHVLWKVSLVCSLNGCNIHGLICLQGKGCGAHTSIFISFFIRNYQWLIKMLMTFPGNIINAIKRFMPKNVFRKSHLQRTV